MALIFGTIIQLFLTLKCHPRLLSLSLSLTHTHTHTHKHARFTLTLQRDRLKFSAGNCRLANDVIHIRRTFEHHMHMTNYVTSVRCDAGNDINPKNVDHLLQHVALNVDFQKLY